MPLISVVGDQGQNVMQNGLGVVGGDAFLQDSESGVRMPLISVVGDQGHNVMHNGLGVVGGDAFLRGFRIWRQVALDLRCRSSGAECYAQWFWGGLEEIPRGPPGDHHQSN